jgi:hypothetical protein
MWGLRRGYHKIDFSSRILSLQERNMHKKMNEKSKRFRISYSLFELCMQSHLSSLCIFGAARDHVSRGWYQSVWWRMLCPDKANSSSSSHPTSPKSTAIIFRRTPKCQGQLQIRSTVPSL